MEQDALKLCRALGYDLNTVEFAVENGIPYAIDFMNPVPDADLNSVGAANFDWIVSAVADMAIAKARTAPQVPELRWSALLGGRRQSRKNRKKKKAAGDKKTPAARTESHENAARMSCGYASSTFSVMPISESFSAGI